MAKQKLYDAIVCELFRDHYREGLASFEFDRSEVAEVAGRVGVDLPNNIGDLIYSYRFRAALPVDITSTAPEGHEWTIELAGHGKYRFRLGSPNRIIPRPDLVTIKIPDATPEIICRYALSDEQALLAKVRYNRLIDVFLGIATYSLQNHLRTTVSGIGQIEIDEIYVGVNRHGTHFVVPVQAKGGSDKISGVQTVQDIAYCAEKFAALVCRAVAAQFMKDDVIALFELAVEDGETRVVDERHYKLVPADAISESELKSYRTSDSSEG